MSGTDDSTKIPFIIINVIAGFATILTLYRSHLPGGSDINGFGIIIWMIAGPAWIWMLLRYNKQRKAAGTYEESFSRLMKRRLLIVPIMAGLCVLPITQLPQFICFYVFRPHLDHVAKQAIENKPSFSKAKVGDKPKEQHGPFPVYEVAVDEAGAVWIVTTIRADGLSKSTLVDGFVLNPTKQQTPFGRKYFEKSGPLHMKDKWYIFEASDEF